MKKTILHITILFLMLMIFFMGTLSNAQFTQSLPSGVMVTVPDSQEAIPGQFTTYIFTFSNTESRSQTFTLNAKTLHGWNLLGPEQTITVEPHSDYPVPITIAVPTSAVGNQVERLILEIIQGAQKWQVHVDTRIASIHKIVVNGPTRGESEPEKAADYPITVVNQGSQAETVALDSTSGQGWSTSVDPRSLTLQPGEKAVVHLFHTPPTSAGIGTSDKITLTLTPTGDTAPVTHTILTLVIESTTPKPIESLIPLRSTWLWEVTSPTQFDDSPALRWIYSLNATLEPDYTLDFYINGNYDSNQLVLPDSLHIELTTPNDTLKLGRIDPLWTGTLPLPTQTALLAIDHHFANQWRLQLMTGTKDDDDLLANKPSWTTLTMWKTDSPWAFRLLKPLEAPNDPDYLTEVDYSAKFGGASNAWTFRGRYGGGEFNGLKHSGDLWLAGYGDQWNFRGEFSDKDGFFGDDDQRHLNLSSLYRFSSDFSWELGFNRWQQNKWTDPLDYSQSSKTFWTRFNLRQHYSLTLSSNDVNEGADSYSQPKVEFRYFYHSAPVLGNVTIQWMQPDYRVGPDQTKSSLDSQYRYEWSDLRYWDNHFHYDITQESGSGHLERMLSYRLTYAYSPKKTWSVISSMEWEYSSESTLDNSLTWREELLYRPSPEEQWHFSLYNVFSDVDGSTLTLYLLYQRQFLTFARSPWSGVEGVVYEDLNGNGRMDPEDPPVVGATLKLDARTVLTGANGRWSFGMLSPGGHRLNLDLTALPYYADLTGWDLTIKHGLIERIYIPVRRKLFIRGNIYIDANLNQRMDPDESPLTGVGLELLLDGKVIATAVSDGEGYYSFNNLLPGHYQLHLDPSTIPQDMLLPVPDQIIDLSAGMLAPGTDWPLPKKEKEIEFTFDSSNTSE